MKETHKFEFTEFRRPSKLATSLNLEDFWGMFRLSFKSNSGSETVRIRFAIVIKRHKPSSQLTLFKTKHNHMLVAFSRVSSSSCFSLRPLSDSREFVWFSFAKTQSSLNPYSLCVLVIPWCWSQWFCLTAGARSAKRELVGCNKTQLPAIAPFVKSPCGVPHKWRQTSPWKSWWRRMRGSIEVVVQHTCPDALISCSNRGCQRSIRAV